jgi:hypothetical protein
LNQAFLSLGASGPEYGAGAELAIKRGWLWRHESEAYYRLLPAGNDLLD